MYGYVVFIQGLQTHSSHTTYIFPHLVNCFGPQRGVSPGHSIRSSSLSIHQYQSVFTSELQHTDPYAVFPLHLAYSAVIDHY